MQAHAIIEIEEGSLNLVVGALERGRTRVLHSLRLPLPELNRESLVNVLRTIGSDVFQGAAGVHVVLGERRSQHFVSTLPRVSPADMIAFVQREALRLSNLSSASDLLLNSRLLRKLPGRKFLLGTTALPGAAWSGLAAAFEDCSITVLSLRTMESCLALAADGKGEQATAVIEVNAGRARFVLCRGQSPVQVRRFLIGGGGEGNSSALTTQLAMELPRTIDWLRETGQTLPQVVMFGPRMAMDDDAIAILRGDDEMELVRVAPPLDVTEDQASPTLGTGLLLDQLCRGRVTLPSMLDPVRVRLPWSGGRIVSLAAATAAGAMCSFAAVVQGQQWLEVREQLVQVESECSELKTSIDAAYRQVAVETAPDPRLERALAMRRPVSRLLADVSNAADERVHIEELKFSSTEVLTVVGKVAGSSRRESLEALGKFSTRLRLLPYVQIDGQEEIGEVTGRWNMLRFKLSLTWRNE